MEVAIGKINSNEEENRRLKEKVKVFSAAVKSSEKARLEMKPYKMVMIKKRKPENF